MERVCVFIDGSNFYHGLKDTGKHVEVACFPKAYHLKQHADKVIHLDPATLGGLWLP